MKPKKFLCEFLVAVVVEIDSQTPMQEDEHQLDECIRQLEGCVQVMTDDPANRSRLYVTEEDIAELPIVSSETVFAVKAAQGTTLEVPDPDEGAEGARERRYRYTCTQV